MALIRPRYLVSVWMIAALAQLAGDVALYSAGRSLHSPFPWLDVNVRRPVPDSLHQAISRYLHDSLGVVTLRRDDTLVVVVPPAARRSIDQGLTSARAAGGRAAFWLVLGLLLLHLPLFLAIGVTVVALRAGADAERNAARDEWREE